MFADAAAGQAAGTGTVEVATAVGASGAEPHAGERPPAAVCQGVAMGSPLNTAPVVLGVAVLRQACGPVAGSEMGNQPFSPIR